MTCHSANFLAALFCWIAHFLAFGLLRVVTLLSLISLIGSPSHAVMSSHSSIAAALVSSLNFSTYYCHCLASSISSNFIYTWLFHYSTGWLLSTILTTNLSSTVITVSFVMSIVEVIFITCLFEANFVVSSSTCRSVLITTSASMSSSCSSILIAYSSIPKSHCPTSKSLHSPRFVNFSIWTHPFYPVTSSKSHFISPAIMHTFL